MGKEKSATTDIEAEPESEGVADGSRSSSDTDDAQVGSSDGAGLAGATAVDGGSGTNIRFALLCMSGRDEEAINFWNRNSRLG